MKIKILILIPLLFSTVSLFAKPLFDSVGVENQNGKKVILHKVDPKDTYYAIGRRYNIRPNIIIQYNNNVPLHPGDIVKVPTETPFLQQTQAATQVTPRNNNYTQSNKQPVQTAPGVPATQPASSQFNLSNNVQEYKVSEGETLYSVSKRFNTSVDDILALNGLKSTTLKAGQILKVRSGGTINHPATPEAAAVQAHNPMLAPRDSTSVNNTDSAGVERKYPTNRYGLFEKNEKGIATWIDDTGLDPNKKLVLHKTAPVGTVVKITNPMTNRTTFAKVVGRFNDNESTKDVIIVMTKNVAESIGALDKRFRVNISYGVPNE